MVEILKDQGVHPVYSTSASYIRYSMLTNMSSLIAVNRLDRLTSGLLILPTTAAAARTLTDEFVNGGVKKEYLARCLGRFPS
jgi:tRNA pseudouridine synthase 9